MPTLAKSIVRLVDIVPFAINTSLTVHGRQLHIDSSASNMPITHMTAYKTTPHARHTFVDRCLVFLSGCVLMIDCLVWC
jgi:hypothetical protein